MAGYIDLIASQIGAPIWLMYLILVWTAVWKLLAMWRAAKHKHIAWFIVMGVINTIGILPILYLYVFSKIHHPSFKKGNKKENSKKEAVKKKKSTAKVPKLKK